MPRKNINSIRQLVGSICVFTFFVLMLTCAISGILAFGGILVIRVVGSLIDPNNIPSWLPNIPVPSLVVFLISAVLVAGFGHLLHRLGYYPKKKR